MTWLRRSASAARVARIDGALVAARGPAAGAQGHQSRRARAREASKTAWAESFGWRVVRIAKGPGLLKRIVEAVTGQDSSDGGLLAPVQEHISESQPSL